MRTGVKKKLSTTISALHWEIIKRYLKKFGSQRRVIEKALELLDNSKYEINEEKLRLAMDPDAVVVHRSWFEAAMKNDWKSVENSPVAEFGVMILKKKPLHKMSFKEQVHSLCDLIEASCQFERVIRDEEDDGSIKITLTHHGGREVSEHLSKLGKKYFEDLGINFEMVLSDYYIMYRAWGNGSRY
jgi:hypothetical protein